MTGNQYALIMAGGGGTRLWPLSVRGRPKQVLPLFDDRSLFRIAVDRLLPMLEPEQILVATVPELRPELARQAPELPGESYIDEPSPRGTASIIGLAAMRLQRWDPDSVLACLTADHFIAAEAMFRDLLRAGYDLAGDGSIVTIGIQPAYASTGYGYLKIGEQTGTAAGVNIHQVTEFREKPGEGLAREYFESGDYLWNSGMFIWRTERVLSEIERQMPRLHQALGKIGRLLDQEPQGVAWRDTWDGLRPETIDYGVMEKATGVVALAARGLGWWDVGTWNRLFELLPVDKSGNVLHASATVSIDTQGSMVYQADDADEQRLIVTVGIENLVIVDTGSALLISDRDSAHRVKDVIKMLRERGLDKYL